MTTKDSNELRDKVVASLSSNDKNVVSKTATYMADYSFKKEIFQKLSSENIATAFLLAGSSMKYNDGVESQEKGVVLANILAHMYPKIASRLTKDEMHKLAFIAVSTTKELVDLVLTAREIADADIEHNKTIGADNV